MRLHRLRVQAFQAFAGTEEVSFDALCEGGLFLVHGDTGAGKTSLLDAVVFALYGQAPGARGVLGARHRSDHAAPEVPTEVELEATLRGTRVRIVRRPKQERPKLRGGGTTEDQHTVRVWAVGEDGSEQELARRHDEADLELGRLLGMSREQFCQVVLLPQGAFAEFLRATSDGRRDVLERLFSTERFTAAEGWLTGQAKAAERAWFEALDAARALAARVSQAAGAEVPEGWERDPSALGAWVGELTVPAAAEEATAQAVRAAAHERRAAAEAALARGRDLAARRARLDAARSELTTWEARRAARDAAQREHEAATRAAAVAALLREAESRSAALAEAEAAAKGARAACRADDALIAEVAAHAPPAGADAAAPDRAPGAAGPAVAAANVAAAAADPAATAADPAATAADPAASTADPAAAAADPAASIAGPAASIAGPAAAADDRAAPTADPAGAGASAGALAADTAAPAAAAATSGAPAADRAAPGPEPRAPLGGQLSLDVSAWLDPPAPARQAASAAATVPSRGAGGPPAPSPAPLPRRAGAPATAAGGSEATVLRADAGRLRAAAGAVAALAPVEAGVTALEQRLAAQEEELRAAQGARAAADRALAAAPAALTQAEEAVRAAREARAQEPGLARALRDARAAAEAGGRRDALAGPVTAAEAAARAAADAELGARSRWLDVRERRLAGMAAHLAAGLVPGEPCPVCGGAEHPAPAAADPRGGAAVGEAEEAAAQREHEALASDRTAADSALSGLRAELAAAAAVAGEASLQDLRAAADAAARAHAEAARAASGLAAAEGALRSASEAHARAAAAREAAATAVAGLEAACESAREALAADRARLAAALGEAEGVAARAAALTSAADRRDLAADALDARARAGGEAARAGARAEAEARRCGFADAAAARAAVRPPDQIDDLGRRVRTFDAGLAERRALAGDPALSAAAAEPAPDLPSLERAWKEADAAASAADGAAALASRRARELQALDGRVEEALDVLRPRAERLRAVRDLAQLADGSGEANVLRMRLSAYVLAARLEEVAAAASVRLERMSGGRYTLIHCDEGARGRRRGGLDLRVVDGWTGQERAPATLSGGETFFASLSLALGLADVVAHEAGGARLETLFVDEGFGSLDERTLEDVLEVLDRLRDGGRTVGIVSHVADLRDRIPAQLRVVKGRDGSHVEHLTPA